jgi:hypothetical protein
MHRLIVDCCNGPLKFSKHRLHMYGRHHTKKYIACLTEFEDRLQKTFVHFGGQGGRGWSSTHDGYDASALEDRPNKSLEQCDYPERSCWDTFGRLV